jgi:hypothetical protein
MFKAENQYCSPLHISSFLLIITYVLHEKVFKIEILSVLVAPRCLTGSGVRQSAISDISRR